TITDAAGVSRRAAASSASSSGARRHASPAADTKEGSAFLYSDSVTSTVGRESAMPRNLALTVSRHRSYSSNLAACPRPGETAARQPRKHESTKRKGFVISRFRGRPETSDLGGRLH